MPGNDNTDGANEDTRELRDAILALTKAVETADAKQSSRDKKQLAASKKATDQLLTAAKVTKAGVDVATSAMSLRRVAKGGSRFAATRMAQGAAAKYALKKTLGGTGGRMLARTVAMSLPAVLTNPAVAALLVGGVVAVAVSRRMRYGNSAAGIKEMTQQAGTSGDLLAESIKTNRSLAQLVAMGRLNQDPFRSSARNQAYNAALYGGVPTARESGNLAMLSSAQGNLAMTQEALARARASSGAQVLARKTEMKAAQNVIRLAAERKWADIKATKTGQVAGLAMGIAQGPFKAFQASQEFGYRSIMGDPSDPNSAAARKVRAGQAASLGRLEDREQITRLNAIGPRRQSGPPQTVRAGTASAHRFSVQQQIRAENVQATLEWQDAVLQALLKIESNGTGEVGVEQIREQQIKFGRPVMGVN